MKLSYSPSARLAASLLMAAMAWIAPGCGRPETPARKAAAPAEKRYPLTGEIVKITDPGRAVISGRWAHIGQFKGPILRGVVARAPYFHNGSAATLGDVVDFYNTRFNININPQQKHDMVAFLSAL